MLVIPPKTDSILIVDPDAVLSFSIPVQSFEPISGRILQILQFYGEIDCL